MATSQIKVKPEAVYAAALRIGDLRNEVSSLRCKVDMGCSKGPAASSMAYLSSAVAELAGSVAELLASDQRRLYEGVAAFEGADSALARMMGGLMGASDENEN